MNSQNRMNAGAEYVLYRILGALQDREGIHPESLLACLGALAGYACRHVSARAPEHPLSASPMSIWALVRRALQKLGKPLPDFEDIVAHVTRTGGTRAFGVVRAPQEHRPRRRAIIYLEQLWPQVLPIAQRFCRRPTQLPVLFGIALQRALEVTQNLVSPTLGASIAMECAVAMSRVTLPGEVEVADAPAESPVAMPPAVSRAASSPLSPIASALRGIRAERRNVGLPEPSVPDVWARVASRRVATAITVAFVAVMTIAGTRWQAGRHDRVEPSATERKLQVARVQDATPVFAPPVQETPAERRAETRQVAEVPPPAQADPDPDAPPPPSSPEAYEAKLNEEGQRQLDINATGNSEMVPSEEVFPTSSPQPRPSAALTESLF